MTNEMEESWGDWSVAQPYEEEQEIPEVENDAIEAAKTIPEGYSEEKVKLYKKVQEMTPRERRLFVKIVQQDAINGLLHALKNLKKTTAEEWKAVIGKLISIKGLGGKLGSFDFDKFLSALIPAVALLAGTLLAMREAEAKESEAAAPDDSQNDLLVNEEYAKDVEEMIRKSRILEFCHEKENGFSL